MAKIGRDEDGEKVTFGKPSPEEEEAGETEDDAAEWDPEGNIPLSRLE